MSVLSAAGAWSLNSQISSEIFMPYPGILFLVNMASHFGGCLTDP